MEWTIIFPIAITMHTERQNNKTVLLSHTDVQMTANWTIQIHRVCMSIRSSTIQGEGNTEKWRKMKENSLANCVVSITKVIFRSRPSQRFEIRTKSCLLFDGRSQMNKVVTDWRFVLEEIFPSFCEWLVIEYENSPHPKLYILNCSMRNLPLIISSSLIEIKNIDFQVVRWFIYLNIHYSEYIIVISVKEFVKWRASIDG